MAQISDPNHVHEPVADNLKDVTDGLSRLISDHVELAKSELRDNVKKVARDATFIGVGAGLLLLGWTLLMFAAGYALGTEIGEGLSFLIIAGVHLGVGVGLVAVYASRLRTKDHLAPEQTQREFARDRNFLHRVRDIMRESRRLPA